MLRRRFAKRKREAEEAAGDADEQWEAQAAAVDDTLASLQLLIERHTQAFAAIRVAPLALWHQLYDSRQLFFLFSFFFHFLLLFGLAHGGVAAACVLDTQSSPTKPSWTRMWGI